MEWSAREAETTLYHKPPGHVVSETLEHFRTKPKVEGKAKRYGIPFPLIVRCKLFFLFAFTWAIFIVTYQKTTLTKAKAAAPRFSCKSLAENGRSFVKIVFFLFLEYPTMKEKVIGIRRNRILQ